ncbi:2'-5' RNA ligase family protein [Nemorincola caseinilytica]|uniref:2'-5' RNA ligase family protein n=1 Tax=Nemorincola caseinilytica TaxID=2054315 RepID=A0ABP8N105_9BACT
MQLYMFAIMPLAGLEQRISEERKAFAERYNCVKALKPPVHITLYEPFKEDPAIEQKLQGLAPWVAQQAPVSIELNDFNYFNNRKSPVVYIDVVKNERLRELRKGFVQQLRKYIPVAPQEQEYRPHFTIGYRDVPPGLMPQIIADHSMRRFKGSFVADKIYLWRHDGANWQILHEFPMLGINAAPTLF